MCSIKKVLMQEQDIKSIIMTVYSASIQPKINDELNKGGIYDSTKVCIFYHVSDLLSEKYVLTFSNSSLEDMTFMQGHDGAENRDSSSTSKIFPIL